MSRHGTDNTTHNTAHARGERKGTGTGTGQNDEGTEGKRREDVNGKERKGKGAAPHTAVNSSKQTRRRTKDNNGIESCNCNRQRNTTQHSTTQHNAG